MSTPTTNPPDTPKPRPPANRPHRARWRRWLWRLTLTTIVVRVLLALFLVPLLRFVASFAGVDVQIGAAQLSLLGLSFRAEDVVVRLPDQPDAPPLATIEDLVVDVAMQRLWHGELEVVDAALAGVHVQVQRQANGSLRLPAAWSQPAPVSAPRPLTPPPNDAPITFALPFRVASARLHDVQVSFDDRTAATAQLYEGSVDVLVQDVGYDDRPGRVEVRLHSPRWFDDAWLRAEVTATAERFTLTWAAALEGVRPARLPLPADVAAALADVRVVAVRWRGEAAGATRAATPRMPSLAASLQLDVFGDELERATVRASAGPATAVGDELQLPLTFELRANDLVRTVALQDGVATLRGDGADVHGTLAIAGLTLARFAGVLAARGVRLPADGLQLQAGIAAELGSSSSVRLHDVELRGGDERLQLRSVGVRDLRTDGPCLAIGSIEIDGPELAIARDADGAIGLAGVRLAPPHPAAAAALPSVPAATPWTPPQWPQLRLGTLAWTGLRATFTDATRQPAAVLRLDGANVRADALTIGQTAPPGRLELTAHLVDAFESLRVAATLTPTSTALTAEVDITGGGITAASLAPWLLPLGLRPTLRTGELRLLAGATVACGPEGVTASAQLTDVAFTDGDDVLLRVRQVHGDGVRLGRDGLDLGDWRIGEPFVTVQRDTDGGLHLLGMHMLPAPPAAATQPTPNATDAPAPAPAAAPRDDAASQPVRHGTLTLERATLAARGAAADEAPLVVAADAQIGPAREGDTEVPFTAGLRVDGVLTSATLRGHFVAGTPWRADLQLDGRGLRGAGLADLLPQSLQCTLVDGTVRATATAAQVGATGLQFELQQLQLADRGEELFAVDRLAVQLRELGPDRVHVGELTAGGVRTLVTATDDGTLVAGLRLASAATTAAPSPPTTTAPPPPAAPATAPPRTKLRLPLLAIDALRLDLDRVVVRDRRGGEGEPMTLTGSVTLAPWAPRLGSAAMPAELHLQASLAPLCRELTADLRIDPYALAPTLDAQLRADGLDLTTLPRLSPALATRLQGTTTNAELHAAVHGRLDLKRRDHRQVDLQRPLAGELTIDELVLRDVANDFTLLTVGAVDVVARAIDPRSGDVLLRAIDVDDVVLPAARTRAGIELLGLRLLPQTAAASANAPTRPPATTAAAPLAPPGPPTPPGPPAEFAIDHLGVQGLALTWRDETTEPTTELPLRDIEFELDRFSTLGLREVRPFTFRLTVRGGEVTLERRIVRSSLFAGLVGSAANAVTGGSNRHDTEQRPLVDEIRVRGDLQLYPQPIGRVQADVTAFELPALRGLAKGGSVDIADGLLDHSSSFELRGGDGLDMKANTVFTWLSLSEPPGGPISTYLRLPAPLDSVLFLLRNEADEQRIPMQLHLPTKGLSSGAIAQAAVDALVAVIADAVTSAAGRAGGVLTGALGLGGDPTVPAIDAVFPFAAGDPLPTPIDVGPLVQALLADATLDVVLQHELGAGDLTRAAALANPPPAAIAASVRALRARRAELLAARGPLAADVAALYGAGRMQEARTRQAVLATADDELGALERTLDQALEMSLSDTPRMQKRRTQAAAVALGQSRVQAAIAALRATAPNLPLTQIQTRPARGVPAADVEAGGRVRAVLRRRTVR